MENINRIVLNRKIGYWNNVLEKLETHMLKEQSERREIKGRLTHLQKLV